MKIICQKTFYDDYGIVKTDQDESEYTHVSYRILSNISYLLDMLNIAPTCVKSDTYLGYTYEFDLDKIQPLFVVSIYREVEQDYMIKFFYESGSYTACLSSPDIEALNLLMECLKLTTTWTVGKSTVYRDI